MGVYLYDEALVAKIKNWTENTNIHLYGPDDSKRLKEVMADESSDSPLQLPLLSISRSGGYQILNPNKKRMTYDGLMYDSTIQKSVTLNAIPINLSYQIDVLTKYQKEADAYMRNLIFNIINFPILKIVIPYNDRRINHNAAIRIITDVIDNSSDRLAYGQFTRFSIGIGIDDAYIWDTRIRDNISIEFEFDESNL